MIRATFAFLLCLGLPAAPSFGASLPRPSPPFVIHLTTNPARDISPAQFKGKVVLFACIQTTCPHCQHATQFLSRMQLEYQPRGLQIVAAAFNQMANMLVPDFIKQFQPTFPVGWALHQDVMTYLQHSMMTPLYVPVFVFIDRKGMIRHQYLGDDPFMQNQEKNVRETIEEMLKEPAPARTAAKKAS